MPTRSMKYAALLLSGLISLSFTGTAHAEPTGHISGGVFLDRDRDNVRDGGETPLTGKVEVEDAESGEIVASTATTDWGFYELDLPLGNYLIHVDNGYAQTDSHYDFQLTEEGQRLQLSVGEYGAVVAGMVWVDENGDGQRQDAEHGQPDVGITISGNGYERTTRTNHGGDYSLLDVPVGQYEVRFAPVNDWPFSPSNAGDDRTDSDVDETGLAMTEVAFGKSGFVSDFYLSAGYAHELP